MADLEREHVRDLFAVVYRWPNGVQLIELWDNEIDARAAAREKTNSIAKFRAETFAARNEGRGSSYDVIRVPWVKAKMLRLPGL